MRSYGKVAGDTLMHGLTWCKPRLTAARAPARRRAGDAGRCRHRSRRDTRRAPAPPHAKCGATPQQRPKGSRRGGPKAHTTACIVLPGCWVMRDSVPPQQAPAGHLWAGRCRWLMALARRAGAAPPPALPSSPRPRPDAGSGCTADPPHAVAPLAGQPLRPGAELGPRPLKPVGA